MTIDDLQALGRQNNRRRSTTTHLFDHAGRAVSLVQDFLLPLGGIRAVQTGKDQKERVEQHVDFM